MATRKQVALIAHDNRKAALLELGRLRPGHARLARTVRHRYRGLNRGERPGSGGHPIRSNVFTGALRLITLNPAIQLGVQDRVGTIQPGKLASLIVTDGDPLEITTQVRHLIVDGREVSTMNRHQELYEMYHARPRANP